MDYTVSPEDFRAEFAKQVTINSRKIIYIDLLHWINMRKAIFDNTSNINSVVYKKIYSILSSLVENGEVICPVSYMIISELDKQKDNDSLFKTCKIIDKFSTNISFDIHSILGCELFQFIKTFKFIENRIDFRFSPLVCIDKAYYQNYILYPLKNKLETNQQINIEQAKYFNMNISQFFMYRRLISNIGIRHDTFLFADLMSNAKKEKPINREEHLINNLKSTLDYLNMIYGKFDGDVKNYDIRIAKEFSPAIFYFSEILTHKARNNNENAKKHKRENDFYDLFHSSVAMAYSNYFFTEKSFHHLLTHKPFETITQCIVESNPEKILDLLINIS